MFADVRTHRFEGLHLVRTFRGVKQEPLAVAWVFCDEGQMHRPTPRAELKMRCVGKEVGADGVFEPLLLEECRAQTMRSLYENMGVEHHLQLSAVEASEPFRIIHFEAPVESSTKPTYFDTDLVFVSHEPLDLEAMPPSAHQPLDRPGPCGSWVQPAMSAMDRGRIQKFRNLQAF